MQQRNRFGGGLTDQTVKKDHRNQPQRNKWAKAKAAAWGKGRPGGGRGRWNNRIDRQASVKVCQDWKVVEEFDLPQLNKLKANVPSVSDLAWCGCLDTYNDSYDKVTTKTARPLKRMENKAFYYVTTMDDPVIEKFAVENAGNVYATDAIVAHLMASPRSVYPWDIVVQKLPGGILFFDKRDSSQFDFLTVSEVRSRTGHAHESGGGRWIRIGSRGYRRRAISRGNVDDGNSNNNKAIGGFVYFFLTQPTLAQNIHRLRRPRMPRLQFPRTTPTASTRRSSSPSRLR